MTAARSASYCCFHRSASARAASSRSISRKARAARSASYVINRAVPCSTASANPRNCSYFSGVRRSPGVGRALGIVLNLLLNQLHAEFAGKGPGFGVLRVSLQCLTDTRQMHVGVPLYREHKVLVRLVAVPASAKLGR